MSNDYSSGSFSMKFWVGAIIICCIGLILFIGSCQSLTKTGPTQVALVRNGGPFDDSSIREIIAPASTYKIPGLASQSRMYIAGNEQRYYKITSDPSLGSKGGYDYVQVPTKDGVNVRIDAQINFRTAFTDPNGNLTGQSEALLKTFDTAYGNRNFTGPDGGSGKVWDGTGGWNDFLNTMFRPVVENAFREQIGSVNCADLVSSCALVQSNGSVANVVTNTSQDNQRNFQRIQNEVQSRISQGIKAALGKAYLGDFKVQLTKVTLPPSVQQAIDSAQANFAQIAEARAQKIQAQYQAQANKLLASSYKNNPVLGYIQAVKSLKGNTNATIILGDPGTGLNIGR